MLEQFKEQGYTYKDFERAIKAAMEKFNISRLEAMCELMLYMCSHGSVEDFKENINFFIEWQKKKMKRRFSEQNEKKSLSKVYK